jgi:hypothetical protein
MKKMNKIVMIFAVALLLMAEPLRAQVFIQDDEFEGSMRLGTGTDELDLVVPMEGGDVDEFVPLGEGAIAMAMLGGAYLLTKRKKSRKD